MFFNLKDACQYLGISKSLLYKMTSKREISFYKPRNGKLYFEKEVLDNFIQQNKHLSLVELDAKLNERRSVCQHH